MSDAADVRLARMRALPARLRIAHLMALLRVERAALARERVSGSAIACGYRSGGLMVRDAALSDAAPHHEGPNRTASHDLILRSAHLRASRRMDGDLSAKVIGDSPSRKEEESAASDIDLRKGPG